MLVNPGTTSQSVDVQILNDSGLPVTGLVAATMPPIYYSLAGANSTTQITLSDLSLITSAYSSGGVKERVGAAGVYRLDVPNGALAVAGTVKIYGEASGKHLICEPIEVQQISAFNPASDTVILAAQTHAGAVIPTVSILTGHTPQTGDAFARIGNNGANLTALGDARLANLDVAVSTRNAVAPPTPAAIRAEIDSNSTKLDVAVSTRSSHSAADVWSVTTRTLSSFGTLVNDVRDAVWGAASRTLSAFGFTINTNANATETAIKNTTDKLNAMIEPDGADFRFDANALEMAPAGGGGGGGLTTQQNTWLESAYQKTLPITSGRVTVVSPVVEAGRVEIIAGDDYFSADGRALQWSSAAWPNLTGATVSMKVYDSARALLGTFAGSIQNAGSAEQGISVELSSIQTTALYSSGPATALSFDLEATLSGGRKATLARGEIVVKQN